MKNVKYVINTFPFYDCCGMAEFFEDMALKGWFLEKIGAFKLYWQFTKGEPAAVHYEVSYFPKEEEFNDVVTSSQQLFYDMCEDAGWTLAARHGQVQVFCSCESDPVPVATDALDQVNTIHKASRNVYISAIFIFTLIPAISITLSMIKYPIISLVESNRGYWQIMWLILLIACIIHLAFYLSWHRKALNIAMAQGVFYSGSDHLKFKVFKGLTLLLMAAVLCFQIGVVKYYESFSFKSIEPPLPAAEAETSGFDTSHEDYTQWAYVRETPFLAVLDGGCDNTSDASALKSLQYSIMDVKFAPIYNILLDDALYHYGSGRLDYLYDEFEYVDCSGHDGFREFQSGYRLRGDGSYRGWYVFCDGNKIFTLHYSWDVPLKQAVETALMLNEIQVRGYAAE